MLLIGSHVSMSGKDMLLGSKNEALSYGANCMMVYTGAPQNTKRRDISEFRIEDANEIEGIEKIIVHAPYIINLANTEKMEHGQEFLAQEIYRAEAIGATCIVLHPGSHVKLGVGVGLRNIIESLNNVIHDDMKLRIALETMAGKGSELGTSISEMKFIFDNVVDSSKLSICIDTCHIHDAGFDVLEYIDEVISTFGADKIDAIHVNDSKNERGAHKDRHENLGYGHIGFETLMKVIYDERLEDVPKLLETPYVDKIAPYKTEIEMIKNKEFNDWKVSDE